MELTDFRSILVTGPQRSGTTFVSRALAKDLNYILVDEFDYGVRDEEAWKMWVDWSIETVIQCPSMMIRTHCVPDDVLVIVMQRNIEDIIASQQRINWSEADEFIELRRYGLEEGVISEIKYSYWNLHKHEGPRFFLEIEYESMKGHPMWVDQEKRRDFDKKQTEVGS